MASLGTLTIDLVARIQGFKEGLSEADRETQKRMKRIQKEVDDVGKMIGTGLAAGAAAAATGLIYMTSKAAEAVDAQADMAAQLQTSYSSLTNLSLAAQGVGVGMETVNGAILKLNDAIGNLSSGAGGAGADALTRLGLTVEQLSSLDADQQIALINSQIQATIPAAEQASVAIDLFGKTAGAAISQLDADKIAAAAAQAEIFGLNLSNVDAAQVQQIGDAFDTFGQAAQGFGGQLANEFAPLIRQLAVDFTGAAKEAGGFGSIADRVFSTVINSIANVMNAIDGIKRIGDIVVSSVIFALAKLGEYINSFALSVVETLDKIPGVDMSGVAKSLREELTEASMIADAFGQKVVDAANKPLAGDRFKEWVKNAQEASQAAAEATVAAQEKISSAKIGGSSAGPAGKTKEEEAAEKAAAAIEKTNQSALESLRDRYKSETQLLGEKYVEEQLLLEERLAAGKLAEDEYAQLKLESVAAYEQQITDMQIEEDERKANAKDLSFKNTMSGVSGFFGNLSTLMNSENKKEFELGKKAALAGAIVDGISAAVGSYKVGAKIGGPILGGAFAAASLVATKVQIDAIKRQQFGGGGGMSAPSAGGTPTQNVNAATTQVEGVGGADRNVYIRGIDPNSLFSGRQLLDLINSTVRDGGRLMVA